MQGTALAQAPKISFPLSYMIAPTLAGAALIYFISVNAFDQNLFNALKTFVIYGIFVLIMTTIRLVASYLAVQKYRLSSFTAAEFTKFFLKSLPMVGLLSLVKLLLDIVWVIAIYVSSASLDLVRRPRQIFGFLIGVVLFLVSYICLAIAETTLGTFTRFGVIFMALSPQKNPLALFSKTQKFYFRTKKVSVDQKAFFIGFVVVIFIGLIGYAILDTLNATHPRTLITMLAAGLAAGHLMAFRFLQNHISSALAFSRGE